jgi:endonuclease-3 related protein
MHDSLVAAYGPQQWWPAQTAFEVILGAYLTQNTAWKAVERSLANLLQAGALTLDGLRAIALGDLQNHIRPSGFHTRKAPALKAFVAMLGEEFAGSLKNLAATPTPTLRTRLLALPALVLKPPMPFSSTPSITQSQWQTSISAASSNAIRYFRPHPRVPLTSRSPI